MHTLGMAWLKSDPNAWHVASLSSFSHGNKSPTNMLERRFGIPVPWSRHLCGWISTQHFKVQLPVFGLRCILRVQDPEFLNLWSGDYQKNGDDSTNARHWAEAKGKKLKLCSRSSFQWFKSNSQDPGESCACRADLLEVWWHSIEEGCVGKS